MHLQIHDIYLKTMWRDDNTANWRAEPIRCDEATWRNDETVMQVHDNKMRQSEGNKRRDDAPKRNVKLTIQ